MTPILTLVGIKAFLVIAPVKGKPRNSLRVNESYDRSVAAPLPIIVRIQCIRIALVQAAHAVSFDQMPR